METRCISLNAKSRTTKHSGESDESRLDSKIAVITGAASGIGRAIAKKFAQYGALVRILDLSQQDAEVVAGEIVGAGGRASAHRCDVTNQAEVTAAFEAIAKRGTIDILVNNAGISHIGNVESTSEEEFDRVIQVNVKGYYNCIYAALPYIKANRGGVILNMASTAGTVGLADRFAYSTSKGAVIAMTFSVARDYVSQNIRCNCISPARVHTPFVDGYLQKNYPGHEQEMYDKLAKSQPVGRMGEPDEIAFLALFLCSDAASFITGTNYPIDGGFLNLHG
jgi:NAD(P)-dependent dehydrogenase (short-subunit alcohol dehydrogenase family)